MHLIVSMSACHSQSRFQRRHILLSSDNEPSFEGLPPLDPPDDIETDDEQIYIETTEDNPFLTSDEDTLQDIPIATSDDIPLHNNRDHPTSDDILLASLVCNRTENHHFFRIRSSSLPAPVQLPTSDDVMFTPRAERRYQMDRMTNKRLGTMATNKVTNADKAELEAAKEVKLKETFFDKILELLQKKGITLAEFLKYVFNPNTWHVFDWKWQGFFRQKDTVKEIFGYWTGAGYNSTTHTFITDWVVEQAKKIVGQESRAISESNMLRKTSMTVDETFFLDYSLENITLKLRSLAPKAFSLFDAFSTTQRQKRELKERSRKKQELVLQFSFHSVKQNLRRSVRSRAQPFSPC